MDNKTIVDKVGAFFGVSSTLAVGVYVYGSIARGDARSSSDVDVAVLYQQTPRATLDGLGLDIAGALEHQLGRRVDLVILNRVSVDLIHRILRDGILVYDSDPAARIRFEVKARNDYFDLLPYLREYRRPALKVRS